MIYSGLQLLLIPTASTCRSGWEAAAAMSAPAARALTRHSHFVLLRNAVAGSLLVRQQRLAHVCVLAFLRSPGGQDLQGFSHRLFCSLARAETTDFANPGDISHYHPFPITAPGCSATSFSSKGTDWSWCSEGFCKY